MKDTRRACETEHDFALVLQGSGPISPEVEDALFEAGCGDATLSLQYGTLYLTFSRTAPSMKEAIISAVMAVRRAGLDVVRIDECDLVTQAEIARRIHRSRQLVNQYISGERGPGRFPSPCCMITERAPLWSWCDVACWLLDNDMISNDDIRDAKEINIINLVLDLMRSRRTDPELVDEAIRRLGEARPPGETLKR